MHDTQRHDMKQRPALGTADPQSTQNRRDFLRAAGLGGAALALAACAGDARSIAGPAKPSLYTVGSDGSITLDFSMDTDVLNYAYALEQLEAAFYIQAVATPYAGITAQELRVLTDVRDHEIVHRDFFAAALGSARIPNLTPNFSGIDFGSRASVLGTARTFEDLGVSAYNGAGQYLQNTAFLLVAGKIVSVEARHAAAIRDLLAPRTGEFAPSAFDDANSPEVVLGAADPFIVETIRVVNTNTTSSPT